MAIYPSRYPSDINDEATKELLRKLLIGDPPPDKPKRFLQPDQPATPVMSTTDTGSSPIRIPVDANAPPPNPVWALEDVAKRQATQGPTKDYSNVSYRPELGIDYLNRTGKVRPADEAPAQVETGATFHDRAAEAPPVRIPTLSNAALADSVVQPPITDASVRAAMGTRSDGLPNRFDPDRQDVPRNAGESDADYAARKHRAFQESLRSESPNFKVRETPTGVSVDPRPKPHGFKQRAEAGLMLALDNLGEGLKAGGPQGAAGSSLVSFLTGLANPGLERKVARGQQIAGADAQAKRLDEQQSRESVTAEREARTTDLKDLPKRRIEAERDKRINERERNWERLVATSGFDPAHNPEHRKIQLEAANDGQILPATPPKALRTPTTPHTSTRTVADGEYPGVPQGSKIRQIWNGDTFVDDVQNGKPAIEAPPPKEASDLAQDNRLTDNEAKRQEYQAEEQQNRTQAESYQKQATDFETQATVLDRQNAAFSSMHESRLTEGQKAQLAKAKELHGEARKASEKASEFWNKRAESDNKARNVPQLKTRKSASTSGAAYAGKTYTHAQVLAWAASRGLTPEQARATLTAMGATIK